MSFWSISLFTKKGYIVRSAYSASWNRCRRAEKGDKIADTSTFAQLTIYQVACDS